MLKRILFAGALIASLYLPAAAFPDRLITFIVPFAAGGSTTWWRTSSPSTVAHPWSADCDRNRGRRRRHGRYSPRREGGAGRSHGRGRSAGPNVAAVGMYNRLPYDPIKDFEPVIMSVLQPMVVITKRPAGRELPGVVAYLKANGSKLNYGSGGVGAQSHLTCAISTSSSAPSRSTCPIAVRRLAPTP